MSASQQTPFDACPPTSSSANDSFPPFALFPLNSHSHTHLPTSFNSNSLEATLGVDHCVGFVDDFQLTASSSSDHLHPSSSVSRPTTNSSSQIHPPFDPHASAIIPSGSWKESEWDAACPFASEGSSAGKQKRNKKTTLPVESELVLAGSLDEGRAQKACKSCRARKSRCDGSFLCLRCETSGTLCVYPAKFRVPRPARKRRQPTSSTPLPPCFTTKVLEHRSSLPTPTISSTTIQPSPESVHRSPGKLSSTGSEGRGSQDSSDDFEDLSMSEEDSRNISGRTTVKYLNSYLTSQEDLGRQHPTDPYQTSSPCGGCLFGSPLSPPLSHDLPLSSYPPSFGYFGYPAEQVHHRYPAPFGLPSPLLSHIDASSFVVDNNIDQQFPSYPSFVCIDDTYQRSQQQNSTSFPFPTSWEAASFGLSPQPQQSSSSWISQFGEAPVQLLWGEGRWDGTSFSG